ncbi:PAS domain-containing protein [Brevundimonas sp.]|uniref:PAS domain-containing protein n=1 Tax=Brevundimonas sp. TaxID=1871086 RepID=UPI002D6AC71D|nr:PAS domain-containing protein [Brevundimonas sp.]HYC96518.1 PAS domain-containing protein [Brevundimonas sp.]
MESPGQRLVQLACALFDTPIGLLTILREEETAFRAAVGLDMESIPADGSVTRLMVAGEPGMVLVIEDGLTDERVREHPLVVGPAGLRFYAGARVSDRDGGAVGSICVCDTRPRGPLTAKETANLKRLAEMAGDLIDRDAEARVSAEKMGTLQLAETMAGVGHFHVEATTGMVSWSDEVFRIHGLEPGSVDPTQYSAMANYHPEDARMIQTFMARAMETGEGYEARLRLTRADGEARVTRSIARCDRDETGAVTAVFGVFQDITDDVRAHEQQAEMVETLKMAETVAGVGHWRWVVESDVVTWSDVVYAIHGEDPTFEPTVESVVAAYHPDDRGVLQAMIEHALATGEGYECQLRIRRPDGAERIAHAKALCEIGPKGRVQALFGVIQDVTEEVRSHEAIATSEARYRLLADRATDIIITYGVDGVVTYVSPSIETVTGHAPATVVGKMVTDLIHPDDVPILEDSFRAYANSGPEPSNLSVTYRGYNRDGEIRWFEARTTVVRNAEGQVVELQDLMRDVTDTKRLEQDLIEARDRAEAGARVKSEFLANMSHELRTPLTSVIGFSGLLQQSEALPSDERRYVDHIATASVALLGVINDILDYSKLEADAVSLESRAFDPAAMARAAAAMVEGQCEARGLSLTVVVDPSAPPALTGDEGRLRQVTLNFLSNAAKFTAKGGVRLEMGWSDGRLRLAVSDTGIGVSAEKIDTLFERFSQADTSTTRLYGGTGLGLSISRRLIEMMGGEIGAESRPGEGSTFWFEVPLPPAEATDSVGRGTEGPSPQGLRILMADDAAANRELVTAILSSMGVALETVVDGAQAVEAARGGGYDLILMDVHMPVMDGLDATRAIRGFDGAAGRIPIVALTANVQPDQVERCRQAGMDDHVGKPIQVSELLRVIAARLEQRAAGQDDAAAA